MGGYCNIGKDLKDKGKTAQRRSDLAKTGILRRGTRKNCACFVTEEIKKQPITIAD